MQIMNVRKLLRRALSAVLSLALLLVLPGCGEDQGSVTGPGAQTEPPAVPTPPPLPSYAPPKEYPAYTGQWEDTDEPLTIFVQDLPLGNAWRTEPKDLEKFLERYLGKSVKLKWIVVPKSTDAAEKLLNQLRIEIAAGGGPDIFLSSCPTSPWFNGDFSWSQDATCLFPNPEKSMRSGVFLPLDGLLENPSFMEPELMNQTVFSAGRTAEGQMVLPITYTYDVAAIAEGVLPEGAEAPANRAQLFAAEDQASILAMNFLYRYTSTLSPSRMLGPLADYDKEELLFTQEELFRWVLEYNTACRTVWGMGLPAEAEKVHAGPVHEMEGRMAKWRGKGQADSLIFPLYNVYDGLTAEVTSYAAINKNTKQANNAMFLLDLLFQPEVLQTKGVRFEGETKVWLRYTLLFAFTGKGISILDGFYLESCSKQDKERLWPMEKQHINAVHFCSEMDQVLYELLFELKGRPKTEEEIADLVAQVYPKLQMILQE